MEVTRTVCLLAPQGALEGPPMEFLTAADFKRFSNPGVTSVQIVSPHNSQSTRVTITRVTVDPGAGQPRHAHASSEQIWLALEGEGVLLLAERRTQVLAAGQVACFADGDIHGVRNESASAFVYLAVTSPLIDFSYAYKERA
jgi:quercetin dioxygenase-like cupin family protein